MITKPTKLRPTLRSKSSTLISDVGTTSLEVQPSSIPTILAHAEITNEQVPDKTTSKSTWVRQAWLVIGCIVVLIALAKSIVVSIDSRIWVKPILASLAGYVLSDLISGIYHWGIDNYGDATIPIFGDQIETFQKHHEKPWNITNQFANNIYKVSQFTTFIFLPINLIYDDPILLAFVGSFSTCILFSQQIHAWAHSTTCKLPSIVRALQDMGILLSRSQHAAHHNSPFNSNYCVVSGIWNKTLDKYKVFETFEKVIFFWFGVRPRSWDEPSFGPTQENSEPPS